MELRDRSTETVEEDGPGCSCAVPWWTKLQLPVREQNLHGGGNEKPAPGPAYGSFWGGARSENDVATGVALRGHGGERGDAAGVPPRRGSRTGYGERPRGGAQQASGSEAQATRHEKRPGRAERLDFRRQQLKHAGVLLVREHGERPPSK